MNDKLKPDPRLKAIAETWSGGPRGSVGEQAAQSILEALDRAGFIVVPKNPQE